MRQYSGHFIFSNHLEIVVYTLLGSARSQPVRPESKSSMRRSCTSQPFIPTLANCKMSLAECLFKCQVEWPSPVPCSSFIGFTHNTLWFFSYYNKYWNFFFLIISIYWWNREFSNSCKKKRILIIYF